MSTKDKQLATVCKDRDRLKDALALARKALLPKQRDELDKTPKSVTAIQSPDSRKENYVNRSHPATRSPLLNEPCDLENFDTYIDERHRGPFDAKERQYETTIRKLRLELEHSRHQKPGAGCAKKAGP